MNTYVQQRRDHQARANGKRAGKASHERTVAPFGHHAATLAQRKLDEALNASPGVASLTQLRQSLNQSPQIVAQAKRASALQTKSAPVQRQDFDEEELMQGKCAAVQRQDDLEEEELLQGKFAPVQRQGDLEEEELLQGKFAAAQRQGDLEEEELLQGKFSSGGMPTQLQSGEELAENRTGLPDPLKSGLEQLSGMDLSDVRVHRNSAKPAQLNALAYAQGQDIHLGPGQEQHLPHEGWHAVQQMQGRVRPTTQLQGVAVNDDSALEREADVMGARALQMRGARHRATRQVADVTSRKWRERSRVMQCLSAFNLAIWEDALGKNESLRDRFSAIWQLIQTEGFNSIDVESPGYKQTRAAIGELGNELLSRDDIDGAYDSIQYYFPKDYLAKEDVAAVKTYNFDGPIEFSPENLIAWDRLANGQGTVDDLRYIHHEIFEIKQIQKGPHAEKISSKDLDDDEEFWDEGYDPGHHAALMVEMRFLAEAINRIYHKKYTWLDVACSDRERGEEFEAAVPQGTSTDEHTDTELAELLTQLKGRKLGSGKTTSLKADERSQVKTAPVQVRDALENGLLIQGKFTTAQRQGDLEEEELLQGKFTSGGLSTQLQTSTEPAENHTGMPDPLKSGLEQLSGLDLSQIRVHHNSARPAQLNALAYAQGSDIHLGPGQEQHLPHEGWHAVQQMQGRVRPTTQLQGVAVNDDLGLEGEADVMGAKALRLSIRRKLSTLQRRGDLEEQQLLQRKIALVTSSHAFSGSVLQRAGDYTGLMLPHERQAGAAAYTLDGRVYQRGGPGQHKLTYHHIIPEGKLLRLGEMVMRFEYLYGQQNKHTDKLNYLRGELTGIQKELNRNKAVIRKGDEAEIKIEGLRKRHDPDAATKARDRGWNDAVRAGLAASINAEDAKRRLQEKEREIETLMNDLALSSEEEQILRGSAAAVAGENAQPARRGTGVQSRGDFLRAEIATLVTSTRQQVRVVKTDALQQLRNSENPIERGRANDFDRQDIRESLSADYSASLGFGGVAWIPGNIHEGPSSRISRGGGNAAFDPDRDDGGSEFETAARHLIPNAQFALLEQLSQNLSQFAVQDDAAFDAERIDQFIDLLHRINEMRRTYPNFKQFDVTQWEQVRTEGNNRQIDGNVHPNNRHAQAGYDNAGIIPIPAPVIQAPQAPVAQAPVQLGAAPVNNAGGGGLGAFFSGFANLLKGWV